MTLKKHWLMTGAAVVIALGVGFGAARILDRPPTEAGQAEAEHAEAGHAEEAGEEAFVALTPQAAARAGVSVIAVQRGGGAELKLPGRVAFAPGAEAAVDAPLGGSVVRVHVGLGDRVAAGSPLITVRSPDGAASRADADAAGATVEAARAAERRDRTLFEQGWVSQARLDVTAAETRRAEAQHRAARARVGAFGAPGSDGLTVVRSPIAGVVTRLSAAPGQVLHEEALQVAAVADPGRVELMFEAPPSAASVLKVGDTLESTVAGSRVVSGVVIAIAPANANGVVTVRARPSGETPPAGSVVSARVSAGVGTGTPVVPLDAVQTIEGAPSVFVQEGGGFRARPVVTGRTSDGRIEIVSGLTGSERIAGAGAFLLKAELAKGEAEHGH
ncbi:efflux RND transporter periplasmic adaptor subunit [Brevundimonas intermedia]|uniref:Efflux RND transporter periplasmic adaptor subunit n=1 Tax=Brevundimonas intermedia TaxID=74315 RepID=A0A4Y9RZ54_9CAUL|nr:efflux RND transporter periplasmic adaptor subunit [Brevundimonas intermedia]TFW14334.1 efflux RND transporter periplasmic adaptor subunit [Brevundimonas intermedia]